MPLKFTYDKDKDIECLLTKGKSSNNNPNPTKAYSLLVEKYGENPSPETTSIFIDEYLSEKHVNIKGDITTYTRDWETISRDFQDRAERIFGTTIPHDITAYLTVNNRNPYSIEEKYFYVSISSPSVRKTVMHELWHFYTWYGLGESEVERLGPTRYNELKEALTVILNVECKDLLPEGTEDKGYPQHQELRAKIAELWASQRDIRKVWTALAN